MRLIFPASLAAAMLLTGCLDMSWPDTSQKIPHCPDGFSIYNSKTCPQDEECQAMSDGSLCIKIKFSNEIGDGLNCKAGYITVSDSELKNNCVMNEEVEPDDDQYLCEQGMIANRFCRKVPDEQPNSAVVMRESQNCTAEQLKLDEKTLRIHIIDVGQGDAIWIQTPTGQNVLIDGGDGGAFGKTSAGPIVTDYLSFHGFELGSSLDALFLTHPHSDHFGGMPNIVKSYGVKNYIDPMELDTDQLKNSGASYKSWIETVKKIVPAANIYMPAEEKFKAGDLMPEAFFGPDVQAQYIVSSKILTNSSDPNTASLIFRISYAGRAFIFTGDAEADQEANAIKSGKDKDLISSNFLKVCHHGSQTSSSPAFLQAVWPDAIPLDQRGAFISSGRVKYSGSYIPNPAIISRLYEYVRQDALFSTSAGDDDKDESDAYRDDNILIVVKPNGDYYACYSGPN